MADEPKKNGARSEASRTSVGGANWEQQMAGAFFNTIGAPSFVIDHALATYDIMRDAHPLVCRV